MTKVRDTYDGMLGEVVEYDTDNEAVYVDFGGDIGVVAVPVERLEAVEA